MESSLEIINSKIKKYKLLRFLEIFLASIFSLIGVVSIVYFLMFLNMFLSVGYFTCFILTPVLSQLYSFIINDIILIKIENKISRTISDIVRMMEDCQCCVNSELEMNNNDVQLRFEQLSLKSKLELLTYIKNNLSTDGRCAENGLTYPQEYNSLASDSDMLSVGSGHTRCRNIEEERMGNHRL